MPISIPLLWWLIVPAASLLALLFAYIFYRQIMNACPGDEQMQAIAAHVREGAYAYLRRQYKVVLIFLLIVAGLLGHRLPERKCLPAQGADVAGL